MNIEQIAQEVYRVLGPGHSESLYQKAMAVELGLQGIPFHTEEHLNVYYKGHYVDFLRSDITLLDKSGDRVAILELKAVGSTEFNREQSEQLLQYMRMTGVKVGYLINFPKYSSGKKTQHLNPELMFEKFQL